MIFEEGICPCNPYFLITTKTQLGSPLATLTWQFTHRFQSIDRNMQYWVIAMALLHD
jgi:hypothetical protein